jgi:2-polyprenyl-6-methoxyphenol hydroxylase-like FAD-dependent oxidoreductase
MKARVLVLGGGIAGLSSALMLARAGVDVTVFESKRDWDTVGAGLTINGPSVRAIQALGILQDVLEQGHVHAGIKVHDVNGLFLKSIISPTLADEHGGALPGAGGILRSTLHEILLKHLHRFGVDVQMGTTLTAMPTQVARSDGSPAVEVTMPNGRQQVWDAVVVAEGLYSKTRRALFPSSDPPRFTGQACWRWVLPRPPEVDQRHFYLGGKVKVGLTPVSRDKMYLFLLETLPENLHRDSANWHRILKDLLQGFKGMLGEVSGELTSTSEIVYRPLEAHLLRQPWHVGAVVLMGDAAHATTPQLAAGAGMAMEDGIVLSQEWARQSNAAHAFQGFFARRFERCKMVVENSMHIGQLERAGASPEEQARWVETSLRELARPF